MSLLTRRMRGAFTLMELILALGLSTVLFVTLLSLVKSVIYAQRRESTMRKLSADSIYALELMKGSIRSASIIVQPAKGALSETVLGYINVNPADMSKMLPGDPQTYFLYCYDPAAGALYKYSGAYPVPLSFSSFSCGNPAQSGQTRELLAGDLESAVVSYSFSRAAAPNIINISYSLSHGGKTAGGETAVSVQQSI